MAKRKNGVGKHKESRSHKTQKRLAIKRAMLMAKKEKQSKKRK